MVKFKLWHRILFYILSPILVVYFNVYLEMGRLGVISEKVDIIEKADDLEIAFLEIRRFEKNILLFKEEENVKSLYKNIAYFKKILHSLEDEIIKDTNSTYYFERLKQSFVLYETEMNLVMSQLKAKKVSIEILRAMGRDIEKAATDKKKALELRRNEKNYIIFREPNAIEKFHKNINDLIKEQPSLAPLIVKYGETFDTLVKNVEAEGKTIQNMRENARAIGKYLNILDDKERNGINSLLASVKLSFIFLNVLLVIAISIIGFFIARNMVVLFKRMEDAFRNLANDDFLSRIVDIEGPDEINSLIEAYNEAVTKLKTTKATLVTKIKTLEIINREILREQQRLIELQKESAMRLLASEIAHEINNPLSSVTTLLYLFLENLSQSDQNRELVTMMIKDNERCQMILNELVEFARKEPLKVKKCNIRKLIGEAVEFVMRLKYEISTEAEDEKNVSINISIESLPEAVLLDPVLIHEAIVNILINAYHFSPDDGNIYIKGFTEGKNIVISIEDEGTGIAEDVMPRIFEPFFTTRKESGGMGLGLSLTKKIIERHLGEISAVSSVGKGSIFKICLPVIIFPGYGE
jgi:two-component system NtrC family sensor kinase